MRRTRWARACRRSWWRPTGWRHPSAWACMAAARPASARISGSSAAMRSVDSVGRHRLAAIGQVAASVRARARMGSRPDRLVLARQRSGHAVRFGRGDQAGARQSSASGAGFASGARRRAGGASGRVLSARRVALHPVPHRPFPARFRHAGQGTRPCRTGRRTAQGAHRARCPHRLAQRFPVAAGGRPHDGLCRARARWDIWCGSSIRRRRISLMPAAPGSRARAARPAPCSAGPKAWARTIAPVSPPMAKGSPRAATRLGWTITVHRTDHAPQTALIALHAAIGPS